MGQELLYNLQHKQSLIFFGILLLLLVCYLIVGGWIKSSKFDLDQKRKFKNNTRGLFLLVIFISIFIIWSTEIYTIILSVAALAAASVIATKEFLLCLVGSFYRTFTRPFSIGDRIEIEGIRGDVVEFGLLSTQIMEVGPKDLTHQYTGRMVTIPNSKFLSTNILNATYSNSYVLHAFEVPVKNDDNWKNHYALLLKCAKKEALKYQAEAQRHFQMISERKSLESPVIEPRVNIKVGTTDTIQLIVRVTVPSRRRGTTEQAIVKNYLEEIH